MEEMELHNEETTALAVSEEEEFDDEASSGLGSGLGIIIGCAAGIGAIGAITAQRVMKKLRVQKMKKNMDKRRKEVLEVVTALGGDWTLGFIDSVGFVPVHKGDPYEVDVDSIDVVDENNNK